VKGGEVVTVFLKANTEATLVVAVHKTPLPNHNIQPCEKPRQKPGASAPEHELIMLKAMHQ
jgi:hypothetical protein